MPESIRSTSRSHSQVSRAPCSSEAYANIVKRFSCLQTGIGSSHQRLARYLFSRSSTQPGAIGATIPAFLSLYRFEKVSDNLSANITTQIAPTKWRLREPLHFNSHQAYADADVDPEANTTARIFVLRGHPSPDWLGTIGSVQLVDPEYFCRWLDFPYAVGRLNEFSLPALPTVGWNILELPLISIGKRDGPYSLEKQDDIDAARVNSAAAIRNHHNLLHGQDDGQVGSSVARDLYVFDHNLFAIEQKITICLQPHEGPSGWALFIWTDAGDDLDAGMLDRIEGFTVPTRRRVRKYSLWPIIRYRPNMGLYPEKLSMTDKTDAKQVPPCASRLHLDFGHSLRMSLMAEDPFYALTEVFAVAAASQNQVLNMIEHKLAQRTQQSNNDFDALPNLRYLKGVVLRQMEQTKQVCQSIQNTEDSKWPRSTVPAATRARNIVKQDYDHIYEHARDLDRRCQEAITVLMSSVTIHDAKEAMAQARRVAKLTLLAFVFVPLSFTTSFFGMNFKELEDQSIWKWAAITVPIMLTTLIVLLIDVVRQWEMFIGVVKRIF